MRPEDMGELTFLQQPTTTTKRGELPSLLKVLLWV